MTSDYLIDGDLKEEFHSGF